MPDVFSFEALPDSSQEAATTATQFNPVQTFEAQLSQGSQEGITGQAITATRKSLDNSPILQPQEASEKYGTNFDQPIRDDTARMISQKRSVEDNNNFIISNSPNTWQSTVTGLGASFLSDPAQAGLFAMAELGSAGLSSIPILGLSEAAITARYGSLAAKAASAAKMGVAYSSVATPTDYVLRNYNLDPMSASDTFKEAAMNTIMVGSAEMGISGMKRFLFPSETSSVLRNAAQAIDNGKSFNVNDMISLHPEVVAAELYADRTLTDSERADILKGRFEKPGGNASDVQSTAGRWSGVSSDDITAEIQDRTKGILDKQETRRQADLQREKEVEPQEPPTESRSGGTDFLDSVGIEVPKEEAKPTPEEEAQAGIEKSRQENPAPWDIQVKTDSGEQLVHTLSESQEANQHELMGDVHQAVTEEGLRKQKLESLKNEVPVRDRQGLDREQPHINDVEATRIIDQSLQGKRVNRFLDFITGKSSKDFGTFKPDMIRTVNSALENIETEAIRHKPELLEKLKDYTNHVRGLIRDSIDKYGDRLELDDLESIKAKPKNKAITKDTIKLSEDPSKPSAANYNSEGVIHVNLSKGEDASHELYHAAHLKALRDDWKANGSQGSFVDFVKDKMTEIHDDISKEATRLDKAGDNEGAYKIRQAVADSINLYEGKPIVDKNNALDYLKTNPDKIPSFAAEMVRQFVEIRNEGAISDISFKGIVGKIIEWVKQAYSNLRSLADDAHMGALGDSLSKAIQDTERIIDQHLDTEKSTGNLGKGFESFYAKNLSHADEFEQRVKPSLDGIKKEIGSFLGEKAKWTKDHAAGAVSDKDYGAAIRSINDQVNRRGATVKAMTDFVQKIKSQDLPWHKVPEYFLDGGGIFAKGSRDGIAQWCDAIQRGVRGDLDKILRESPLEKAVKSGKLESELSEAIFYHNSKVKGEAPRVDSKVIELGKKLSDHGKELKDRATRGGANIGDYDGYITATTYDMDRISRAGGNDPKTPEGRQAAEDHFVNKMKERLDPKTFSDVEDPDAFLRDAHFKFKTGYHLKDPSDNLFEFENVGSNESGVTNKMNASRTFHFKDAASWLAHNQEFGEGNLVESIIRQREVLARKIGLLEKAGGDPKSFAQTVFKTAMDSAAANKDEEGLRNLLSVKGKYDTMVSHLVGEIHINKQVTAVRVGSFLRNLNLFKLGGVVTSAIPDIGSTIRNLSHFGINPADTMQSVIDAGASRLSHGEQSKFLEAINGIGNDFTNGIAQRVGGGDVPGKMSQMAQSYLKLVGLGVWDDAIKQGSTLAIARQLGKLSDKGFEDLGDTKKLLDIHGITSNEWDAWRTQFKEADGNKIGGMDWLENPDMAKIKDLYLQEGNKLSGSKAAQDIQLSRYKDNLYTKLRSMFIDESSFAVPHGGLRQTAELYGNADPNTWWGQLRYSVAQFKNFGLASVTKIGPRDALNYSPSELATTRLPFILSTSAAFGYLSLASKNLINGKSPQSALDWKTWMHAMAQSGGAGIYGDFLYSEMMENRFGQSWEQVLEGPTLGTTDQIVKATFDVLHDKQGAKTEFMRIFKDNIPSPAIGGILPTKAAMDYLIKQNLMEWTSPGYKAKLYKKAREEGQPYLFDGLYSGQ